MRDAAAVHDRDVDLALRFPVAVLEQPLAQRVRVGLRDLAAEELRGERRHAGDANRDRRYAFRERR